MSAEELRYAALILQWSRTLDEHHMSFDEWLSRRHRRGGGSRPARITVHHAA